MRKNEDIKTQEAVATENIWFLFDPDTGSSDHWEISR